MWSVVHQSDDIQRILRRSGQLSDLYDKKDHSDVEAIVTKPIGIKFY